VSTAAAPGGTYAASPSIQQRAISLLTYSFETP